MYDLNGKIESDNGKHMTFTSHGISSPSLVLRCTTALTLLTLLACGGGGTTSTSPENEQTQQTDLKSNVKPLTESVSEDAAIQIFLADSVSDIGGFSITIDEQPQHGTLIFDGNMLYTYTPKPDFFGDDSFTFTVTASNGDSAQETASIKVIDVGRSKIGLQRSEYLRQGNTQNLRFVTVYIQEQLRDIR